MFLKRTSRTARKIGTRVTLHVLFYFVFGYIAILVGVLIVLASSFKSIDHQLLDSKLQELAAIYRSNGIEGLNAALALENTKSDAQPLFVRILDDLGETRYIHIPPSWVNFSEKDFGNQMGKVTWRSPIEKILLRDGDDAVELSKVEVGDNGEILQVGKNVDEREALMEKIALIFLSCLVPVVGLSYVMSALLANRAFAPIRDLIETVKSVKTGEENRQLTVPKSDDEIEELVRLFNDMLARIQDSRARIRSTLDDVAHDLRTPLTRMRGSAEVALSGQSSKESLIDTAADTIESCDQMLSLINTIMDITAAESGTLRLKLEIVDVDRVVDEVVDLYSMISEDKNIKLAVGRRLNSTLRADRTLLKRAIGNLVDNAIKYSKSQSQVHINVMPVSTHQIRVEVTDQGIGMSEEDQARAWDRLFRADQSRSIPGMGLGLSLVKSIVLAHGGRVEIKSELGQGSTFALEIPAQSEAQA